MMVSFRLGSSIVLVGLGLLLVFAANARIGQAKDEGAVERPQSAQSQTARPAGDLAPAREANATGEGPSGRGGQSVPSGQNADSAGVAGRVPAASDPIKTGPSPQTPRKPKMLYGRIEEIISLPGAKLPVELKARVPKLDPRGRLSASAGVASAQVSGSFPVDWRGVWSGTLKIHQATFSPVRWQIDAAEANKERELLRPGQIGSVSFVFTQDSRGRIQLEPTQVIFTAPLSKSRYSELLGQMQSMGDAGAGWQFMQAVPYMYAMHLGNLESGVGVTGNDLTARLVKNEIKELAPGVLEQVVVTYNAVRSRATGKTRYGYSESVIRLTRQASNRLYVQAAMVNYLQDGQFEDKFVLYGNVQRQAAARKPVSTTPEVIMLDLDRLQRLFEGFPLSP